MMISRAWSRKSIAICLSVAVLSVYSMVVLAAPGQGVSGELSISGATPSQVTVNGQLAESGLTVLTGSLITTGPENSAVVSLGKLGRVELAPNSSLSLNFTETGLSGQLSSGRLMVSTGNGVSSIITTKDGSVVGDSAQANVFSVDLSAGNTVLNTQAGLATLRGSGVDQKVAAGNSATAGMPTPGMPNTGTNTTHKISGGALAALLGVVGGAIVIAIIATTNGDGSSIGGGTIPVSPTK